MLKEKIKNTIGNLLLNLQPKRAATLSKHGMTIMYDGKFSIAERLMRKALLARAEKNKDYDTLAKFQHDYWVNQGSAYFLMNDDSFETSFLPECSFIFDILKEQLSEDSEQYNTLVEIGTGNGKVLNYLSDKFPKIEKLVGIDLSKDQIEINNDTYKNNSRLEFFAADAVDWVKNNGQKNMIFVTSRGVLEYFTEQRLQDFFNTLNGLGTTIFVAIEPNDITHDFVKNTGSQPYGLERSFSHNYSAMFQRAGFKLWHDSVKDLKRDDFYFRFVGAKN